MAMASGLILSPNPANISFQGNIHIFPHSHFLACAVCITAVLIHLLHHITSSFSLTCPSSSSLSLQHSYPHNPLTLMQWPLHGCTTIATNGHPSRSNIGRVIVAATARWKKQWHHSSIAKATMVAQWKQQQQPNGEKQAVT